jgi:hypothetical protein
MDARLKEEVRHTGENAGPRFLSEKAAQQAATLTIIRLLVACIINEKRKPQGLPRPS